MLNIYIKEKDVEHKDNFILFNDALFCLDLADGKINEKNKVIAKIIKNIDKSTIISDKSVENKYGEVFDINKLSSGCKTVINIINNPNKIITTAECGNNALIELFKTCKEGNILLTSIPSYTNNFNIDAIIIYGNTKKQVKTISELYPTIRLFRKGTI